MRICDRLKEERKRLKMNQEVFAVLGGVSKRSQINYESGKRSPDGEYWSALAAQGADIQYILTGVHTQNLSQITKSQSDDEAAALAAAAIEDVMIDIAGEEAEESGIRPVNIKDAEEEHAGYGVQRAEDQQDESSTEASALSPRDEVWLKIGRQLSEEDRARLQEIGSALVSARHVKDEADEG
ncbi:MAG: helix-turn-helix transcriptional regulator [Candidatus Sedimenticola sp. (ex Thyasira tokunagai)]